jgi:predicted oxidoreductase (fatty acid repression mutant protein)
MSAITPTTADTLLATLATRRSVRRLRHGIFPPGLTADLIAAADHVPSAFDAQPWRVVVVCDRHDEFWDGVIETIKCRLEGDRRERYLVRAQGMRAGGMTLLIFEEIALTGPRDNLTVEEARDHASQSLGMLQLALWLTISAHGLATSLQHWQFLIEDVATAFVGLPAEGFRLVTFMPVGFPAEPPEPRAPRPSRLSVECAGHGDAETGCR